MYALPFSHTKSPMVRSDHGARRCTDAADDETEPNDYILEAIVNEKHSGMGNAHTVNSIIVNGNVNVNAETLLYRHFLRFWAS